jgi:hypothetical protein
MRSSSTIALPRTSALGLEAAVAGDDDRPAFVAPCNLGGEKVRGLALEWHVADLVNDPLPAV